MPERNIIVVGGSAGAIHAVSALLSAVPADLPAAICVAIHIQPTGAEWLSQRFSTSIALPVSSPVDEGQPLRSGHVYIAPPDRHLIVKETSVLSQHGPRENMWRPAIDVLFRTAAVAHGPRVIGILLSGELDDGTAGMQAIKTCGGVTIVQDPDEAIAPAMPRTALANVEIDHSVRVQEIPSLLRRLLLEPARAAVPIPDALRREAAIAEGADSTELHNRQASQLTALSCPECAGPLWRTDAGGAHFRCLVGHAYQMQSLAEGADQELDRTLWAAIRLFEQRANISFMMANHERSQGREPRAKIQMERAAESRRYAQRLRDLQAQTVIPSVAPEAQSSG